VSGELFLHKMHIAPYELAGPFGHEPKRTRKLLAHRSEIKRLMGRLTIRGFTLVPLQVYFKNGKVKVELGLAKGRKLADRRQDLRQKAELREARAAVGRTRT
jgi:SsrA-binding protein